EYVGHLPDDPPPEELRSLLTTSFAEGAASFRAVGNVHMLQLIRRFDGKYGTRLAWLQHGIEHESYHRGQLAAWVRLSGRVPALTQAIQGS
ncbi:MAG TPA: DinB family protein, partial [Longimicrobiales bacterium]|nr:DinB family protein [Longimicrobiales bacterium]